MNKKYTNNLIKRNSKILIRIFRNKMRHKNKVISKLKAKK